MTNQEILTKAIEKAIAGGWRCPVKLYPQDFEDYDWPDKGFHDYSNDNFIALETIIFNHDFAKALWGDNRNTEGNISIGDHSWYHGPEWMWRLQQMVIADDPIAYLGAHMSE